MDKKSKSVMRWAFLIIEFSSVIIFEHSELEISLSKVKLFINYLINYISVFFRRRTRKS